MVNKIIAYEDPGQCQCNEWNYNTLFIADDLEDGGGDFYAYSDEVAEGYADPPAKTFKFVPNPPYSVTKAYLGRTCECHGESGSRNGVSKRDYLHPGDHGSTFRQLRRPLDEAHMGC